MHLRANHPYPSRRSAVAADNLVATSQPLATQAGVSILAKGGNAVDAALATAITLTVVEPSGNGLGSDAFAIVWDGETLHGLNASGRAPAGWTPDRFAEHDRIPFRGWDSVTVPGAVSAWVALSERFGTLPFDALFEPAIRYARDGFPVSPVIATLWQRAGEELGRMPGFANTFLPEGRAPRAGEYFKSPGHARTLELIARTKGKAFYEGEIAEEIATFAKAHDAALTVSDMASHSVDWCGTISRGFDDAVLHEIPPNGQGIAALMGLGILSQTGIREMDIDDPMALHLQIEAMKLALRDAENYVADLDHMTATTVEDLLDDGYLASRAHLIDTSIATDFQSGAPKHGGTVYLTTADASGMMVSFIQSNYAGFGSGVVVPGTGVALQNRGAGFSLDPKHQNFVAPGKRPFHTIIPGFVTRSGQPQMAFGVMGGHMQHQGHVQMVHRIFDHGQNPQAASDAPRWIVQKDFSVQVEAAMPRSVVEDLERRGHQISVQPITGVFGGAQLIYKDEHGYIAGSDHRKEGHAAGF